MVPTRQRHGLLRYDPCETCLALLAEVRLRRPEALASAATCMTKRGDDGEPTQANENQR